MMFLIKLFLINVLLFSKKFPFVNSSNTKCPGSNPLEGLKIYFINLKEHLEIFNNCKVNDQFTKHLIEPYSNNFRELKFEYNPSKIKKKLTFLINENLPQNYGEVFLSKKKFDLNPKEIFELFLNYNCPAKHKTHELITNFKIDLSFSFITPELPSQVNNFLTLHLMKVCTSKKEIEELRNIDLSYVLIVISSVFILLFSILEENSLDHMENIIVLKHPELRNLENSFIYYLILFLIFLFCNILNVIKYFILICIFIVYGISTGIFLEFSLKYSQIVSALPENYVTNQIDLIFVKSNLLFIIFSSFGFILSLILIFTNNIIINDFLVIAFCISTIRLFKCTSIKFMIGLSSLAWIFLLIEACVTPRTFSDFYRLEFKEIYPVYLKFKEFQFEFYDSYIFLSISDIVLPGMLINFFIRFDRKSKVKTRTYFIIALFFFVFALMIKIICESYFYFTYSLNLLSLPLIILCNLGVAYYNSDLEEMLMGFKSTVFDENEISSSRLNEIASFQYKQSFFVNRESNFS